MTGASDEVLTWPRGRVLRDDEVIPTRCPECARMWRVHRGLGGFRLRCVCDAWIRVPRPLGPERDHQPVLADSRWGLLGNDEPPAAMIDRRPDIATAGATTVPMVRSAIAPGVLVEAPTDTKVRWTNRTVLELAAMMAALIGPYVSVVLLTEGRTTALLIPFASLASGLLVLTIGATAPLYTFGGLRATAPRYFAEAGVAAGLGVALAALWTSLTAPMANGSDPVADLQSEIGLGWALFVVALCPALFEEFAFRGLLQGRLQALFGLVQGRTLAGIAFALAHGVTLGLPFHIGLGLYLCWLRDRSNSLLPGMLTHFVYNAAIVAMWPVWFG